MRIGNGRGFRDKGQARNMLTAKTGMSAMVYRRGFGQLEVVLPRGSGAGRCPYFDAGVVARCRVFVDSIVPGPLGLAVAAARPAFGAAKVV